MLPHYEPPPPPPSVRHEYRLPAAFKREADISKELHSRLQAQYILEHGSHDTMGSSEVPSKKENLCPRITGFTCTLEGQKLVISGNKKSGLVLNYDGIAKNMGAYCGVNLSREELEELSLFLAIRGKKARVFSGIGTWVRFYSPEGDRISGAEGYLELPVDEFGIVTISLTEGNKTTLRFSAAVIEEIILGDESSGLYLQDGAKYHEFINEPPLCAGILLPSAGLVALRKRGKRGNRNLRKQGAPKLPFGTKGIKEGKIYRQ
ncbi:MAG: hypothetical protein QY312_02915 [Candidatus Dojkabacteria bacterium]|nr:MAG: hypothetical protein QY312_02915 [Candidatus Dojkabacteria bacterium]